jgi:hypothetical protein
MLSLLAAAADASPGSGFAEPAIMIPAVLAIVAMLVVVPVLALCGDCFGERTYTHDHFVRPPGTPLRIPQNVHMRPDPRFQKDTRYWQDPRVPQSPSFAQGPRTHGRFQQDPRMQQVPRFLQDPSLQHAQSPGYVQGPRVQPHPAGHYNRPGPQGPHDAEVPASPKLARQSSTTPSLARHSPNRSQWPAALQGTGAGLGSQRVHTSTTLARTSQIRMLHHTCRNQRWNHCWRLCYSILSI